MFSVLIVAAGNSTRMGGGNKQLLMVDSVPVILRSVKAFCDIPEVLEILVAVKEEDVSEFTELLSLFENVKVIGTGGDTRQTTVKQSLKFVSDKSSFIAIHDGARPLVRKEDIVNTFKEAKKTGGAVLGVMVKDTIKIIGNNTVKETPLRDTVFAVQTPQVFNLEEYKKAFETAEKQGLDFTDDSQLFEKTARVVTPVIGHYDNIKITTPEDIFVAEALLKVKENIL